MKFTGEASASAAGLSLEEDNSADEEMEEFILVSSSLFRK